MISFTIPDLDEIRNLAQKLLATDRLKRKSYAVKRAKKAVLKMKRYFNA